MEGLPSVAFSEGVTGLTVGDHRHIAPVPRAVPERGAFRDDAARDGAKLLVHVAGELVKGGLGGLVCGRKSEIAEKRIGVLRLIVRPNGRIVGATAGRVNQASFGAEQTLGGSDLGEPKHTVEDRTGSSQVENSIEDFYEFDACLFLLTGGIRQGQRLAARTGGIENRHFV